MRKFILQIIITMISYSYSFAQLPTTDPIYTPVFTDDFNTTSINSAEWIPRYSWGTPFNTNNISGMTPCGGPNWDIPCLQMNLTANHNIIANGSTCELIGIKENVMGDVWTYPSPCTSPACSGGFCLDNANPTTAPCLQIVQLPFKYSNGMLSTIKKFKYGYFEIKFKMNGLSANTTYNTYSPTFWLFNADANTPWSEIDIYEINAKNEIFTNNIHVNYPPINGAAVSDAQFSTGANAINLSQWHTAAVNWTPDYIDFYLDNNFLRRSTLAYNQGLIEMPLIIENNFPMLNFCVGLDPVNTPFPITYEIDYVHVLQAKQECSTDKAYCNVTETTFDSKLYKSLSIGGSGCSANFNNGIVHAAGADFVLLDVGFEAGSNMEMLIDTQPCYNSTVQQRTQQELIVPMPPNFQQIYNSSRQSQH